ncbi:MAG: hypothetical protein QXX20_00590 [Candidatus Thermoplasmatota archaeon]
MKEIAFGLRGLDATVVVPDSEGGFDHIAEEVFGVKKVEGVEATQILGRL